HQWPIRRQSHPHPNARQRYRHRLRRQRTRSRHVRGSGKEISEADFNAALKFGHEAIQPAILAQKELAARAGKTKRQITLNIVPDEILNEAKALAGDRIVEALLTPGKLARESAVSALTEEIGNKLVEKFGE